MAVDLARETFIDLEPVLDEVHGIWDAEESKLFAKYRVSFTFTGRVMGGVPQKPEAIEGWIRQRITGGDLELRQLMNETLIDLGAELPEDPTLDEIKAATKHFVAENHANTFRRDANGLFLAEYQIKAGLKENVAILFPYNNKANRMGPTSKAARSFWAERVFVDEPRIYLGRTHPDGTHLQVGHVTGPKGARSTLTYYDFCEQPSVTFTLSSMQDMVKPEMWRDVLMGMQRNGIGAIRSLGFGQFKVTAFDKL